jgi:arylsulfatase
MFNRQRQRHLVWMKKYKNRPDATRGPALTGIENARPETLKLNEAPSENLPFDVQDVIDFDTPWTQSDK